MSAAWLDLVILRHGEAESFTMRDETRELTAYGRARVNEQATLLSESGFKPDEIVHSPFIRTTQTADICQSIIKAPRMRDDESLLHSAQPELVSSVWQGDRTSLLLVSHMPLVGRLIQYLCPQSNIYGLPVAGFVRLKTDMLSLKSELIFDGRN